MIASYKNIVNKWPPRRQFNQGSVIALASQENFHLRALPNIEKFGSLSLRYNG